MSLAGKMKVKVKSGKAAWHVAIVLADGSSTVQVAASLDSFCFSRNDASSPGGRYRTGY